MTATGSHKLLACSLRLPSGAAAAAALRMQIGSGLPIAVSLVAIVMGLNLLEVVPLQLPSLDVDTRQVSAPPAAQVPAAPLSVCAWLLPRDSVRWVVKHERACSLCKPASSTRRMHEGT